MISLSEAQVLRAKLLSKGTMEKLIKYEIHLLIERTVVARMVALDGTFERESDPLRSGSIVKQLTLKPPLSCLVTRWPVANTKLQTNNTNEVVCVYVRQQGIQQRRFVPLRNTLHGRVAGSGGNAVEHKRNRSVLAMPRTRPD